MLENARRQVFLVLLTIAAAIVVSLKMSPNWGADLKGGVQFIYEVPEKVIQAELKRSLASEDAVMEQTISVIAERVDPTGTLDALVSRHGKYGIIIELPYLPPAELAAAKERISSLGKLEMRVVATDDYLDEKNGNKKLFDLAAEKKRLEDWLKNGGKQLLKNDWKAIDHFNDDLQNGPIARGNLRWFVHFVEPDLKNSKRWDYAFTQAGGDLASASVAAFEPSEYNGGSIPEALLNSKDEKPRLIELVAINMNEVHFSGEDLEATGVRAGIDQNGNPSVDYQIVGGKAQAYADWSEKYIKKHSAIILNNVIKSAPVFISRIPGSGQITGQFTQPEVDELVKVLRTGSLKVEPELRSMVVIGPTLGARSVKLGGISLAAGALAVFSFVLFYYRLSGVVACLALLLNVFLLWSAVLFMHATLTLPGLGGIVLTMGMAVDANVLIYERIREELKKGKDLLRATRAGFERAMVVILDANITTFLTGLVLYNVGVGPVRGFAVTLMVGIVTTVFTQFFVTRLLFHYLIETKRLTSYRMRELLRDSSFDFVRWVKPALTASLVAIVFGVVYAFAVVPQEVMLGTDFTGGANLQMVFDEPSTAGAIRERLAQDKTFSSRFFNPQVNTVEEQHGKSAKFNVRIKLTSEMREQIDRERQEWIEKPKSETIGRDYEPPYVTDLKRIFEKDLAKPAFSDNQVVPSPDGVYGTAQIVLHFKNPIRIADAQKRLQEKRLPSVAVQDIAQSDATESRNPLVEWNVRPDTDPWSLFPTIRDALGSDFQDVTGKPIALSDPFPEAQEIEGRMVGELRNAAIGALIVSWVLIMFYLRIRFHEYSFGLAAVVALVHDVLVSFACIVVANHLGWVHAEINLNMVACFLTIIGYSVNDTIVVFDRIRENLAENRRLGEHESFRDLINRSVNQTLSRTILTSGVTLFCVLAQLAVNYGSDSDLESFAFAMVVGILTGTYSSIYIAAPILILMRKKDPAESALSAAEKVAVSTAT
ncbi:MAG: hypothetical protein Fur0037_12510 [Planctomycetota bacterium]